MGVSFKTFGNCGYGIYRDLRSRLPYYKLDFTDAYNYRVIPSTLFIFFTNLLPAIAFAQDMFDKTNNLYGVNEALMSSALAGVVFGLFAGQPLCVVGVSGPISIFSYTVYELITPRGTPYFPFMCWIYLWAMVMHFVIAVANWVSFLSIILLFLCDVFGFFICIVYIQKGCQILSRQFENAASGFLSVVVALLMTMCGIGAFIFGSQLHYFRPWVRKVFVDYGTPLAVIFFTGFVHFGGALSLTSLQHLPITKLFEPTIQPGDANALARPHGWFIHFWPGTGEHGNDISVGDVFLALPFALLLTFLFYFDHNVSLLMCLAKEFPLKKPATFHWDFALLGLTTGVAGLIGIPPPNGLIPQAPLHTALLVVHDLRTGVAQLVVEQRLTNTVQGIMTFVMMLRPFLVVLGLLPQAVLAGLFFIMGITGLHGNAITNGIRYIFMDHVYIEHDLQCPPVFRQIHQLPHKKWFYIYLLLSLIAAGLEFGITNTKGAVGFPGVLMFFALCAKWVWPYIIPRDELQRLDSEVADEKIIQNLKVSKTPRNSTIESKESDGVRAYLTDYVENSSLNA